jgi:endoglycosylceramidase
MSRGTRVSAVTILALGITLLVNTAATHPLTHSQQVRVVIGDLLTGEILSITQESVGAAARSAAIACGSPGQVGALAQHLARSGDAGCESAQTGRYARISRAPVRLDSAGRWFVDEQGRVVVLRGVNMVSKIEPFTLSAEGFGEEDARIIAAAGFNVVRVGVIHSAVEPSPGQYDDAYIEDIARTVAMLARHGILSLLDFHQDLYGPVFNGAGLPEWATFIGDLVPPPPSESGFPREYFENQVLWVAFDNFWNNASGPSTGGIGVQDRYAAAWRHVAKRFAREPGVMGYEIMNEPFPGSVVFACFPALGNSTACMERDQTLISEFHARVTAAIREVDPVTLVFFEPNVMFALGAPTHVIPPPHRRVGFSFHPYGCQGDVQCNQFLNGRALGDRVDMVTILDLAEQYSQQTNLGLLATEWGALTPTNSEKMGFSDVPEAIRSGAAEMDAAMMSWIYWTYANKTPYEVSFGSGEQGLVADLDLETRGEDNVRQERFDAIVRPFPQAVAGTPKSWSYDPVTRVFELNYLNRSVTGRALAAGAQTEIFVPSRHYPSGYAVTVHGASVVSPAGAERLRLVNRPGNGTVKVTITPGP